jgi:hypothetical protein
MAVLNYLNRVKDFLFKQNIGLLLLFFILCFMYALNCMTPLLSDDYFISFIWSEGMRINGMLPEDAKKVCSFSDVFESLKAYYFIWGGRIPGQTFMTIFAWWGKEYFNVVNSFMTVFLIMEIYWISHEGKVSFDFNYKYIFWIFFALWSFNTSFVDTFMWLSGSCEYLWMMVLLLAFLLPYVRNYYDADKHNKNNFLFTSSMFVFGAIAGCSREMLICWIILAMTYWLWLCKKADRLYAWQIFGLIGLCVGYAVLIFAPGNFARLASDSLTKNIFIIDIPFLFFKILLISIIFIFHIFLWHFFISFFSRKKSIKDGIMACNLDAYKNVIIAKICALIALGTMFLLFFIMYSGVRPSFATLVFLIVSVASLFRASEISGVTIIHESAKTLLKTIGVVYFIITAVISFQWNYANLKQWENTLQDMINANKNVGFVVLKEASMSYPAERKQLVETINFYMGNTTETWYGAHVIKMPYFHEGCYYNFIIPKYYELKEIRTK